jgi:hypothetical protein
MVVKTVLIATFTIKICLIKVTICLKVIKIQCLGIIGCQNYNIGG